MTDAAAALIVGIAGILGTLIASGLGLYFTARARTAPLRELLYSKQIDTILDILHSFSCAKNFVILATVPDSEHRERAIHDLSSLMPELGHLEAQAAAILPTELYVQVVGVNRILSDLLELVDANSDTTALMNDFVGHTTKCALLSRVFMGIDELSQESVELFAKSRDIDRISALATVDILTVRERES